jgi:hypothetical protein
MGFLRMGREPFGDDLERGQQLLEQHQDAYIPEEQLPRTTFHEAGHAVAAWALGGSVQWVRLFPDGSGEASYAIPMGAEITDDQQRTLTLMKRTAAAKAAGSVAETIAFGSYRLPEIGLAQQLRRYAREGELGTPPLDISFARQTLNLPENCSLDAILTAILDIGDEWADRILRRNWAQVEAIQSELMATFDVSLDFLRDIAPSVAPWDESALE